MSKHTPGPWYCHSCGRIVDGHDLVAAAAPDLLAALKDVRRYCPVTVQDEIDAAIAKAEGVS